MNAFITFLWYNKVTIKLKGDRIKNLRESINVLQTELAEKIGVSKQTLYKYENNIVTNIPSYKIELIAKT
ncbi:helix-turn-helix domain-containing protein [Eubacterium sp. SB2]|uniref:helix-turn-helix domain-containing protein n=1 Tax=Clostridia TaxID=186801 RepID=UPI00350E926F